MDYTAVYGPELVEALLDAQNEVTIAAGRKAVVCTRWYDDTPQARTERQQARDELERREAVLDGVRKEILHRLKY